MAYIIWQPWGHPAAERGGAVSDETPVTGELAIRDHLAGYRLDEIIARGGVAVAYRAFEIAHLP